MKDLAENQIRSRSQAKVSKSFPTLPEIKKKLPAHCFRATVPLSLYYVARDVVFSTSLVLAMRYMWFNHFALATVLYPFYAFALGTVMWGIFVLGHDCGHGSFSPSSWMNFAFGCFLHSSILVPYYPWKLTHHYHHKNTGNIDNDEVFHPVRARLAAQPLYKALTFIQRTVMAPFLWFYYLMFGYSPKYYVFYHFWPFYGKFREHYKQVLLSHVGWGSAAYLLYKWSQYDGFYNLVFFYFVPLVIFGAWLVVTTFLHHNEPGTMRWYAGEKWNYVKGNLSSVDRIYGPILDNITHHIGTHQVHHLFPIVPHYHLVEATVAFRKEFPEFVAVSNKPIIPAFIDSVKNFSDHGTVPDDVDEVLI